MDDYPKALNDMMAIWNEPDADARQRLADSALETNLHFVDPNYNILGRNAFLDMVATTREKFPGVTYGHDGEIDAQNNFYRYHWIIKKGDVVAMKGFDCVEMTDEGKVLKVIGFFGEISRSS